MELLSSFWVKCAIIFVALFVVAYIALMIIMNKHNRKRRMNQKRRRNL